MPQIIPETDRVSELATLRDERKFLLRRRRDADAGQNRYLTRLIAQVDADIARNIEQIKEKTRTDEVCCPSISL